MTTKSAGELLSIQYLRGIAALMVVVFHAFPQMERMGYDGYPFPFLAAGVEIFFVISGFIMWHTAGFDLQRSAGEFVQRRLTRIVPLYWIMSAITLAILLSAPKLLQSTTFDPGHVAASFLFLPAAHPVSGEYFPLLSVGWTLNFEMAFYALFALAMLVASSVWARAAIVLGVLVGLAVLGAIFRPAGVTAFYTDPILLEFVFGIVLGIAYRRGLLSSPSLGWAMIIIGVFALVLLPIYLKEWPRLLRYGVPSALIVAGALCLRTTGVSLWERGLHKIGDASYSLYLSHFMVMSAVGQIWRKAGLSDLPYPVFITFSVGVCLVAGFATYYAIERPTATWFVRGRGRATALAA